MRAIAERMADGNLLGDSLGRHGKVTHRTNLGDQDQILAQNAYFGKVETPHKYRYALQYSSYRRLGVIKKIGM